MSKFLFCSTTTTCNKTVKLSIRYIVQTQLFPLTGRLDLPGPYSLSALKALMETSGHHLRQGHTEQQVPLTITGQRSQGQVLLQAPGNFREVIRIG